jgi:hypothetical protein
MFSARADAARGEESDGQRSDRNPPCLRTGSEKVARPHIAEALSYRLNFAFA